MRWLERWRGHKVAAAIFVLGALLVAGDLLRWWLQRPREIQAYEARPDWSALNRGAIDFSGFVYRDRDRDGRYDLGDLPMAWVLIEATAPDGARHRERSNLSGFANFPMSLTRRPGWIRAAGEYQFAVQVPTGWTVTSRNTSQSVRFAELHGAPADLVATNPSQPVGLAPDLVITGRLTTRAADGTLAPAPGASLTALDPQGEQAPVAVGADATFRIPARPGRWRLVAALPGTARAERPVEVRDVPVRLAAIVLGETPPPPAGERRAIDFESVTQAPVAKVPSGFAGLDWFYLNAIDAVFANAEGYVNTLSSGRYVGYSSSGHPVTISRPGGFDFHGGYFGVAMPAAEGETLHVQAWRRGALVGEEDLALSCLGAVFFDADYRGIDRLTFTTLHYWQFATDDLEVGVPAGKAAPAQSSP